LADPSFRCDARGQLFYLVPGVTAVMAYLLFDERLDMLSIVGMVICAAAVLLVNKSTAPARS
jgi:drug/metabolite transporter (DMT)-like permease